MRIGDWVVEPSLNRMSRGEAVVHIRPKAMDVLTLLAARAGQVVPRETILEVVWAKRFLADSALASAVSELRKALGDDPSNPRYIETIAKRGYRLLPPVSEEERVEEREVGEESPPAPPATRTSAWRRASPFAAAALALLGVTVAWIAWRSPSADPIRLEIVRFENLGPPDVDYIAAGITEEIAARLARIPGVLLVASRAVVDRSIEAAGLSLEGPVEGPTHVLSGSVRWAGPSDPNGVVRITPKLVRIADGATLWSAVYERSMKDVFAVQSEIAREVALHFEGVARSVVAGYFEPPPTADPEAHAAYLRGIYDTGDLANRDAQLLAVALFEQAVARDPGYLAPRMALSRTNALLYHFGLDRSPDRLAAATEAYARLVEIAPGKPETLATAAYVRFAEMNFAEALEALDAGREGLTRFPFGLGHRADILRRLGRFDEALALYPEHLGRTPTRAAYVFEEIGITAGHLGLWEAADTAFASAIRLDPARHSAYAAQARNILLMTGSIADARAALAADRGGSVHGQWSVRWLLALCERDWAAAEAVVNRLPETGVSDEFQRLPGALLLAETYRLAGNTAGAREAFEASRATLELELAKNPDDFRRHSALAVCYAGLGRREDAVTSAERAVSLCPATRDAVRGAFYLHDLALVHVMTGALDDAAAALEALLSAPHHPEATPLLGLDPRWAPLRDHPSLPHLLSLLGGDPGRAAALVSRPASRG